MAENKHDLDTPAGYVGNIKPDGAEKLPTKHYPSSGKLGEGLGKGKSIIEGPCSEENEHRGYHK